MLTKNERKYLLSIARQSISSVFSGKDYKPDIPKSKSLLEQRGVFVTLTINKKLRGCIGYIIGVKPLYEAVFDNARAAAFKDPRFYPLNQEEFKNVSIEITVLSPLKKIEHIQEINVGKHGILMKNNGFQGVLLPQVAIEYKWDRQTFLENTCIKASMSPDCWKDQKTEIYIFSGEVFDENNF